MTILEIYSIISEYYLVIGIVMFIVSMTVLNVRNNSVIK